MRTTLSRPLLMASALGALVYSSSLLAAPPGSRRPPAEPPWASERPQVMEKLDKPIVWSQGGIRLSLVGLGIGVETDPDRHALQLLLTYTGLPKNWRFDEDSTRLTGADGPLSHASHMGRYGPGDPYQDGSVMLSFHMPAKGATILREFSGRFDDQHQVPRISPRYSVEDLKKPIVVSKPIPAAMEIFDWTVDADAEPLWDGTHASPYPGQTKLKPGYGYLVLRFYAMGHDFQSTPRLSVYGSNGTRYETSMQPLYFGWEPMGVSHRPYIGAQLASPFGSADEDSNGVRIASIKPRSPAQAAGLRAGDVIIRWDNQAVNPFMFADQVTGAGREVTAVIKRAGKELSVRITPAEDPRWVDVRSGLEAAGDRLSRALGVTEDELDPYADMTTHSALVVTYIVQEPVPLAFRPDKLEFTADETVKATKFLCFALNRIVIPSKIRKAIDSRAGSPSAARERFESAFDWPATDDLKKMRVSVAEHPLTANTDGTAISIVGMARGTTSLNSDEERLLVALQCSGLPADLSLSSARVVDQSGKEIAQSYCSTGADDQGLAVGFGVGGQTLTSLKEFSGEFTDSRMVRRSSGHLGMDKLGAPIKLEDGRTTLRMFDVSVTDLPATRVGLVDYVLLGGRAPLPSPKTGSGYLNMRFYAMGDDSDGKPPIAEIRGPDGKWHRTRVELSAMLYPQDIAPPYMGFQMRMMGGFSTGGGGVPVTSVDPIGPAAQAGMKQGDIVSRMASKGLFSGFDALGEYGKGIQPGKPVSIDLLRAGKPVTLTLTPVPDPLWTDAQAKSAIASSGYHPHPGQENVPYLTGYSYTYGEPVPKDFRPESIRFTWQEMSKPTKTVKFSFRNVRIPIDLQQPAK